MTISSALGFVIGLAIVFGLITLLEAEPWKGVWTDILFGREPRDKTRVNWSKEWHGFRMHSPWQDETAIDVNDHTYEDGSRHFNLYMQADGPNGDGTSHHAAMGFRQFQSREIMMRFLSGLLRAYEKANGKMPLVLVNEQQTEDYAKYAMGELKDMPTGANVDALLAKGGK